MSGKSVSPPLIGRVQIDEEGHDSLPACGDLCCMAGMARIEIVVVAGER
jgi:hypothetical protein